jgi:dynein heavy chain
MNFNDCMTSAALQAFLESPIEMKSGDGYAPPAQKKCIYFVDDMNMRAIDQFETQSPMTLLRQHLDYQYSYDRPTMTLKDVKGVNYVSCMNPTAGSFTINLHLQHHFSTFSLGLPSDASVKLILSSMLPGHLEHFGFSAAVQVIGPKVLEASVGSTRRLGRCSCRQQFGSTTISTCGICASCFSRCFTRVRRLCDHQN